jgi:hypothetical protein
MGRKLKYHEQVRIMILTWGPWLEDSLHIVPCVKTCKESNMQMIMAAFQSKIKWLFP